MSKIAILAESYRIALWDIMTHGGTWPLSCAHYAAYVALVNAGGRKLQRKVHAQAVRSNARRNARLAWLAAE